MTGGERDRVIVLSDGDVASLVALKSAAEMAQGGESSVLLVPRRADRLRVLSRQAAAHRAEILETVTESGRDADMLLAVGRRAGEKRVSRVVWPAHGGVAGDPESVDLDRASAIANTALLVERLLEIESAVAPAIEVPFADLSDRQIAELAADLGLVPGEVWWTGRSSDDQVLAAERWGAAFDAAGVPLRASGVPRADARRG